MKYIYGDARVRKFLETWARRDWLFLCHFFLSDRGETLQKSREGMVRSVLLQLIKAAPELAKVGFPTVFDSAGVTAMPHIPLDWKSLNVALERIISFAGRKSWKVCIFIDGVDEYRNMERAAEYTEEDLSIITHGDETDASWGTNSLISESHKEVLDFFLNLIRTNSNLKICLLSRELPVFEESLSTFSRLRLHQHTQGDIAAYARTRLSDRGVGSPAQREDLANDIAQRSSGVFLWARLIVGHIIDRYSNEGPTADLQQALDFFPPQLGGQDGLYMKALSLVAEKDRADGRRVLQMLLGAEFGCDGVVATHALQCTMATGEIEVQMVKDTPIYPQTRMTLNPKLWEDSRKWFQKRLMECTGGLLECEGPRYRVNFIHQTAKEFVLRDSTWDQIYGHRDDAGFDLDLTLLSGLIVCTKLSGGPFLSPYMKSAASEMLRLAKSADTGSPHRNVYVSLVDELARLAPIVPYPHQPRADRPVQQLKGSKNPKFRPGDSKHLGHPTGHSSSWDETTVAVIPPSFPLRTPTDVARDFLITAASHELTTYIRSKYISQPEISLAGSVEFTGLGSGFVPKLALPSSTLDALLDHHLSMSYYFGPPDWANVLLQSGATPGWAWLHLLRLGFVMFGAYPKESDQGDNVTRWIQLVKTFLDHGADPSATVPVAYLRLTSETVPTSRASAGHRGRSIATGEATKDWAWVIQDAVSLPEILWTVAGRRIEKYVALFKELGRSSIPTPTSVANIKECTGVVYDTDDGVFYKEESQSEDIFLGFRGG